MKWSEFFTSSVGKKLVMALTGLFLIAFLVVHVGLNACIWVPDHGETFNKAAYFMGNTAVPRILEVGLFAFFIIHIVQAYSLTLKNQRLRKVGYAVSYGNRGSKWYSRSMGLLGTIILLFLVIHIYHFWTPSRLGGIASIHELEPVGYSTNTKVYHDLYGEMVKVFTGNYALVIVIIYVLGCISLCYHLMHGFQSAFRTLGVHNKRYISLITATGYAFAIIVSLGFAMMPVSFYMQWIS
jgi:succinate dehydrogenase / fumarate reductase cytochrome b subunit